MRLILKKIVYILREMTQMVREHKVYFLAPVLLALAFLSLLVYYVGPSVIITFIYAGV